MGERLGFEVLGPLSVTANGRALTVGGARQRTVLALLLLNPGRIVPVDTLVDAVWNSGPPATARTQIAIVIAALRKTFKAEGRPGATPVASIVAWPAPQPQPGRPIEPAMAARATDIQIGCSPWSARCIA